MSDHTPPPTPAPWERQPDPLGDPSEPPGPITSGAFDTAGEALSLIHI